MLEADLATWKAGGGGDVNHTFPGRVKVTKTTTE
jgi:hypothetical protein